MITRIKRSAPTFTARAPFASAGGHLTCLALVLALAACSGANADEDHVIDGKTIFYAGPVQRALTVFEESPGLREKANVALDDALAKMREKHAKANVNFVVVLGEGDNLTYRFHLANRDGTQLTHDEAASLWVGGEEKPEEQGDESKRDAESERRHPEPPLDGMTKGEVSVTEGAVLKRPGESAREYDERVRAHEATLGEAPHGSEARRPTGKGRH